MNTHPNSENATALRRDFYVEERCCMSCGVPQSIAPELVGWKKVGKLDSCSWIRQPENPDEIDRAIKILHAQELDCHRYAGKDPEVLRRLPELVCDEIHPETAFRYAPAFGPSDAPLKFELSASKEGLFERLWRKLKS